MNFLNLLMLGIFFKIVLNLYLTHMYVLAVKQYFIINKKTHFNCLKIDRYNTINNLLIKLIFGFIVVLFDVCGRATDNFG